MNELNNELLKEQDAWLRRMARHLVEPSSAADDLAQDTWVAGIEAGAASLTRRPWLFRVLSNKVVDSLSGRRRADDALRMVQRDANLETSAPDEAIADLELRENLLREVQALDEPQRTAIHRVYFLGLSTREAGEALGVSRSTISERTKKGLDELRVRLDEAYGTDRKAWATLLAPAASRVVTVGAGGAGGAATLGGSATGFMKTAGAVVVLAGASWLTHTALSESSSKPVSVGATGALAPRQLLAEVRGPLELANISGTAKLESRTSAPTIRQEAGNATVTARFLRPGGEPAAGASWSLSGFGANAERVAQFGLPDDWEGLRGTLDEDGNLVLAFDPPQAMQFSLTVSDDGVVAEGWRWGHVRPDERRDLGTIRFQEACEVRGFVVDEADQPIVGRTASIQAREAAPALGGGREAREQRVTLDPTTGAFVLDAVPAGKVLLSVSGGLSTRSSKAVNVELGSIAHVRLAVDAPSGHIGVKARLGAFTFREAPLPLENVWLEGPDGLRIGATTYHRGSRTYRFEGIPDVPLTLVADHPAIEPVRIEQLEQDPRPTINLIGRSSILWSVTDPSGADVDQFSIEMMRHDTWSQTPGSIMHDGTAPLWGGELGGLWPGTYDFTVRTSTGTATVEVLDLEAAETRAVTVSLAPITVITGRLIRPNGDPVRGETVRLIRPAEEDDSDASRVILSPNARGVRPTHRQCVQQRLSDAEGRFEFVVDDPGRYLVLAGSEMRPSAWSELLELEGGDANEPVTLTLEEPSGIVGSFTPPAHLPQAGWLIQLAEDGPRASLGTPRDKALVDDEGRFSISSLAAGSYRLYATLSENTILTGEEMRPHGAYLIGSVEVHAGQATEALGLRIQAPIPAYVGVTIASDEELKGKVRVSFRPLGLERAFASTGTQGTVSAIDPVILEPGTYAVSFSGDGWRGFDPRELSIPENQAVSVTIPLDVSEHRVRLIRGGEPLCSVRVTLSSPATESHKWVAFDANDIDAEGWLDAKLSSGTWKLFVLDEGAPGEAPPAVDFPWPPVAAEFEF